MPRVTTPMLSMTASGQIGKALTFRNTRGTATARKYAAPGAPRTPAQHATTVRANLITKLWSYLDNSQRMEWTEIVTATQLSPYHHFLKTNLKRLACLTGPKLVPTQEDDYDAYDQPDVDYTITPDNERAIITVLNRVDMGHIIICKPEPPDFLLNANNIVDAQSEFLTSNDYETPRLTHEAHYYQVLNFAWSGMLPSQSVCLTINLS